MTELRSFAAAHRLKTTIDTDGTTIVLGRSGQIYEHGNGQFGVLFQSEKFTTREAWNNRRKQCEATGMELWQDGDYEGCLLFDPRNKGQAKAAIQVADARPKRQISPEQLAKLQTANQRYRFRAGATLLASAGAS